MIAQYLIDRLPVPSYHALLIQIDEVALYRLTSCRLGRSLPPQINLLALLFQRVAECLHLLKLLFLKQLQDDIRKQVYILVTIGKSKFHGGYSFQFVLTVAFLRADNHRLEEALKAPVVLNSLHVSHRRNLSDLL